MQLQQIEEYEAEMIKRFGTFSVKSIEDYATFQKEESFSCFFEEQLIAAPLSHNSVRTRKTTLTKLIAYNKGKKVYFSDLTYKFIKGFDGYLHKICKLSINTIHKHHKHLGLYINLAIQFDLMDIGKNPYLKFKPKTEDVSRVFLLPNELEKIEQLEIGEENLDVVRDMFLMQCYTGLRFSDITKISMKHIEQTSKGLLLNFKAQKTKKNGVFPLYALFKSGQERSKPEVIIYKHIDKMRQAGDNTIIWDIPFFKMTNQHANRKLKELATLAHINKSMTTHLGRRTFATFVGMKVPPTILQMLMQHTSLKETARYISNNPLLLAMELEKVNWD